jgi:acyl carrier protein
MSISTDTIRRVIAENGRLPVDIAALRDHDDLYQAGLSSHASVNVMLGLEDEFALEFPAQLLNRATFRSIDSIREALESLGLAATA